MRYLQVEGLSRILRWSMEIIFCLGVFATVTLPYTLKAFFHWYFGGNTRFLNFVLVMLMICGACALTVVRQLIIMFRSIHDKNPFVQKNVYCLRNISVCCFVIAACFTIKCFLYLTFLTFVVAFMFIIAGFSALVFCGLFHQAVEYKSENDLTI